MEMIFFKYKKGHMSDYKVIEKAWFHTCSITLSLDLNQ